jgi:hypothetical protein
MFFLLRAGRRRRRELQSIAPQTPNQSEVQSEDRSEHQNGN